MKTVLLTGGAGMIGSNLSRALLEIGYSVIILDDFSSGIEINLDNRSTIIKGSVEDLSLIDMLFNKYSFEYVFHLAALFANQNSVDHPERDLNVNGMGTLRVLQKTCESYQMGKTKRFFYASSSCVYGMQTGSISENNSKHLETPYAITKLLGEQYTSFFHDLYKLPFTTFRFFNSYGPGELPGQYRNVIPNFIDKALKNKAITITGTGEETRDFTFIDDTITAIISTIGKEQCIGKIYNIATGRETKIIDLAKKIINLTGSKSEIIFKERRNWDHTLRRCGNIDLIQNDTGFMPKHSIEEGLIRTIEWLKPLITQY
jgi:UDP-glucose 4-epimerase